MLFGNALNATTALKAMRVGRALTLGEPGRSNKLYHGVTVRPRDDKCCSAVEDLADQRILSAQAPLLPLTECENPAGCRCVYVRFDERRDRLRRESDAGLPARAQVAERRVGRGRRITDG